MDRERLEKRLEANIAKAEKEIQSLPVDPEASHICIYQNLTEKMEAYHHMLRDFCSSPKPVDHEEEPLYD